MIAKIKSSEGYADIEINNLICHCGFCDNFDEHDARIELNFKEQQLMYTCSKCHKLNVVVFGKEKPPPYPSISIGR